MRRRSTIKERLACSEPAHYWNLTVQTLQSSPLLASGMHIVYEDSREWYTVFRIESTSTVAPTNS